MPKDVIDNLCCQRVSSTLTLKIQPRFKVLVKKTTGPLLTQRKINLPEIQVTFRKGDMASVAFISNRKIV